jgi:hypothetical protein
MNSGPEKDGPQTIAQGNFAKRAAVELNHP